MQKRWRIALPAIGLILFSAVSYHSWRMNRELQHTPSRYFWWSAIRLDSDPANKRNHVTTRCDDDKENCVSWDLPNRWVDPGWLQKFLIFSALPAFAVGGFAVGGLGRLGISQVSSFMFLMPVLILAWYYFIGWLLDRWSQKHTPTRTGVV
jgi:hypothetical protein